MTVIAALCTYLVNQYNGLKYAESMRYLDILITSSKRFIAKKL